MQVGDLLNSVNLISFSPSPEVITLNSFHRNTLLFIQHISSLLCRKISGGSSENRLQDPCLPQGLLENATLNLDPSQLTLAEGEKLKKVFIEGCLLTNN
jgi:hypothetical protein